MRRAVLVLIGIVLALRPTLSAQVTAKEIQMDIPTYLTGPDDPAPPFLEPRVYPYPLQTDITRNKVLRSHRVVVLENEYIRILILPDIGGRILAALDKTNDDFDFIYYNHVIKPGLVALRGAWLSGGIEWNFPTLGHTVNTVSPVKYAILEEADGGLTCLVGTEEWVRRMKWEVFITLSPGRSAFTTRIRLENRTLTHNNAYFWANAATHDWDDTRVIFPPTDYTYAGGRSNPTPWPVWEGRDVSWVKNTATPYDYFCGTPGDFSGAYNYDHDNGTAHFADRYDSPGKKFWTWGTAPSGAIWEDLLTDSDGQYIEVQSGRLLTQGDTWVFEPLLGEEWQEWWYPLKKMHGFVEATPEAALNVEVGDKSVFLALNVTRAVTGAALRLSQDGRVIHSEELSLIPAGYYQREVPVAAAGGVFRVEVTDAAGRLLIGYSTAKPALPPPELQPVITETEPMTAEAKFHQGYYALKHWDAESALAHFRRALELDPNLGPALRWLGILYYKTGRTADALALFERCLRRDEDDSTARYYRALAKKRLGVAARTEEDLAMVSRRAAFRTSGAYVLAALEAGRGDYGRARQTLRTALTAGPGLTKPRVMLAALDRRLGDKDQARLDWEAAASEDPIDSLVRVEERLLRGWGELSILRDDPEYFLEAAWDYAEFGLYDDAARVVEIYLSGPEARFTPMLYYDLGYFCQRQGLALEAKRNFQRGGACSLDYAFPFRTESEESLRAALQVNPGDARARYLLGTLLAAELRWEEGLAEFEKAASSNPPWAMLYRNMGELLWKKAGRMSEAVRFYERAVALDRSDFRLFGALDELYARIGDDVSRDRMFHRAPAAVQKNFNTVLRRAQYYLAVEEPDEALHLLQANTFLPWEGWTSAHQVYVLANAKQALALIARRDFSAAVACLQAAKDYPRNLGSGRPASPVYSLQDYYLGVCHRSMGQAREAESDFQAVLAAPAAAGPETAYYQALSLAQLGRSTEARALLLAMKTKAKEALTASGGRDGAAAYQAALACQGLGEAREASAHYGEAVKLEPSLRWTSLLPQEQKIPVR